MSQGERRRRKEKAGYVVVGDDEIQLCKMTSRWAWSAVEQLEYSHSAGERTVPAAADQSRESFSSCTTAAAVTSPTLFYVDSVTAALKYNRTAAAEGGYETVAGSCWASKIEWSSDGGYVEKNVSLLTKIDADFVHVRCRLRRRHDADDERQEPRTSTAEQPSRTSAGPRRRRRSDDVADIAQRRARQLHRDQLRRSSPHFVGTVGLPDPLSNVIGPQSQRTSSSSLQDTGESAGKHLRRGHDGHLPAGFGTRTVDRRRPTELGDRKTDGSVDAESLSRSERDLKTEDRHDAGGASSEVYDQWIVRVHPLTEVADRAATADGRRMDVLVLALESVSSLSFDRTLPESRRLLVSQPNTVLFTGYNVIGDAAPANLIPMLTGTSIMLSRVA